MNFDVIVATDAMRVVGQMGQVLGRAAIPNQKMAQ